VNGHVNHNVIQDKYKIIMTVDSIHQDVNKDQEDSVS